MERPQACGKALPRSRESAAGAQRSGNPLRTLRSLCASALNKQVSRPSRSVAEYPTKMRTQLRQGPTLIGFSPKKRGLRIG
jgi:hypothetical protein